MKNTSFFVPSEILCLLKWWIVNECIEFPIGECLTFFCSDLVAISLEMYFLREHVLITLLFIMRHRCKRYESNCQLRIISTYVIRYKVIHFNVYGYERTISFYIKITSHWTCCVFILYKRYWYGASIELSIFKVIEFPELMNQCIYVISSSIMFDNRLECNWKYKS